VIYSVEALASISKTKQEFLRLMEEKYHPQLNLLSSELGMDERIKEDFDRKFKALLSVPPLEKDE
jgi:hypothetical protein